MAVRISRSLLDWILAEAAAMPAREVCGLLLGTKGEIIDVRPAHNISKRAGDRFEIDPQLLFDQARAERAGGTPRIGHYHSHPNGRAEPSRTDAQAAALEPAQLWMIVAGGEATLWRADSQGGLHGRFERVDLAVG
ncbi:M67 family metallopeptidase [Sphingomonas cavernae]|uniref:M67 family peptidase n=1 Tax=Sphingomonas cavernae TaxID=2320861 RepID=A0A418W666_9SPHN|nr:M67 family metallopeptidase [Sphingomonas cavernae]RJF85489.1 M67 family peptidase [Sphingomonas cavernae]